METKSAGRIIVKKFIAGIVVGVTLAVGTTAFADQIKQYVLTVASYPIFVNGKEFKDEANPILNYEGSTYVPLAKLGELTGVNYKWNESLKRVEIDTKPAVQHPTSTPGALETPSATEVTPALPQGGTLEPDTKVIEPKGLVVENGETVFYAYDRDGKFRGRFTDDDNAALIKAVIEKKAVLPPTLEQGWIGLGLVAKIYQANIKYDGDDLVLGTSPAVAQQKEFFRFGLPNNWIKGPDGEITVNSIKIRLVDGGIYFNIADLQKAGLVQ